MHKEAFGEGECFAHKAGEALTHSEIEPFGYPLGVGWFVLPVWCKLDVALGRTLSGKPPANRCNKRRVCSFGAHAPIRVRRCRHFGHPTSKPPPAACGGTGQSRSRSGSSCCPHSSTSRPPPVPQTVQGQATSPPVPSGGSFVDATPGLFLSQALNVGRETPKMRPMPRIEDRSW